ncbi:hypothetical protein NE237_008950 [Protea cynaroides]|uniref:RNase H type-1 domain-containing protein n=1 Tax=Protea cynaroides TaxID=273540 RepID=A0A9Q0KWT2_9MAGN|nr:hypothetical protein NE237_008950 [Protea cynaroides]
MAQPSSNVASWQQVHPKVRRTIWTSKTLPKIKHFLWHCCADDLPSSIDLVHRKVPVDTLCRGVVMLQNPLLIHFYFVYMFMLFWLDSTFNGIGFVLRNDRGSTYAGRASDHIPFSSVLLGEALTIRSMLQLISSSPYRSVQVESDNLEVISLLNGSVLDCDVYAHTVIQDILSYKDKGLVFYRIKSQQSLTQQDPIHNNDRI